GGQPLYIFFVAGKDLSRPVLRLLHVRLGEGVDPEDRARDRGCELPAEKLAAEVVRIGNLDVVRLAVGAVRALARRRHETLPLLPRRLGEQLLEPEAEPVRIREDDLVAAGLPPPAEREPELQAGIAGRTPAGVQHRLRLAEQPVEVDGHQRRRQQPGHRERGVPAADRGLAGEHGRAARPRQLLQRRAGVGDRDEAVGALAALPEEVVLRARLECGPRLGGDDEQRALEVERIGEPADRLRVRRVEHVEPRRPEPAPYDLRGERGAAHPQQHEVVDLGDDAPRELPDLRDALPHPQRLVEPPEPVRLVLAGPDGRIPLPDPLDELPCVSEAQARTSSPRLARIPSSSSSNESENFSTPSRSSVSVTSSTETPAASTASNTRCASSTPCSSVSATSPWSWKASIVSSGIVSTVSGPISSST